VIVTVTPNPVLDRTLTVPRLAFNEVLRATGSRLDWGGKGFNVSRALQALGAESAATGFIGGATGRLLERGLHDLGIATDLTPIASETRTNIVVTEASAERHIKVNEAGPTVEAPELAAFFAQARERVRRGDLWVLSGSLPPGVPPDFYARLITLIQKRDARALLDASGEPLRLGCTAGPYLVKPNALEAQEVTGKQIESQANALDATAFFLRQGVELVALSLGAEGLLLASQRLAVRARPPQVPVQNAVGAGDALLAGLVWALACPEGLSFVECGQRGDEPPLEVMARWGVACGTAAAMQEGVGVGTRAEVEKLYRQIHLEQATRR
jgi:1-phosphofructokinase family hexose kinase